jgi:hypothetical protein
MSAHLQAAPLVGHLVIDEAYDRTYASDGFSRYGAYLAMRLPAIVDDDPDVLTDPVRWAAFAWASATTPVMSPAYLDWHGPIEDIQICWDDGQVLVEAVLRTGLPVELPGWRGWERDRCGNLVEPRFDSRLALARVVFRAVLDDVRLPSPPREPDCREDVVAAAKAGIRAAADAVEDLLAPAVEALADPGPGLRLRGFGR